MQTMRKVYARSSNWSKTEKLVKELDATLKILTGDEQKSLYVADTKKQVCPSSSHPIAVVTVVLHIVVCTYHSVVSLLICLSLCK